MKSKLENGEVIEALNKLIYKYNQGKLGNEVWSKEAVGADVATTLFAISNRMQGEIEAFITNALNQQRGEILNDILSLEVMKEENLYEKERKGGKFDWRVERETGGNEARWKLKNALVEFLTKLEK